VRVEGFVGPTNVSRSLTYDAEDTINLYPIYRDAGAPKSGGYLQHTPGLTAFLKFDSGPVRALFGQDGRLFAVAGVGFYELFASQTALLRGTVAVDGNPATISSSGSAGDQLFITSAGDGYIFTLSTNLLVPISDAEFPTDAVAGGFVDSYFVALQGQSVQFQISDILDGTSWNGLDVAQVSESSDNKIGMLIVHRNIWLFGTKTTEIWTNIGALNFPFAPIPGAPLDLGIIAPYSAAVLDNTVFWLGGDSRGSGQVFRAEGYTTARRISTYALETYLQGLPHINDAVAWTYQQEGHLFYVLYVPQADWTFVYDVATDQWHKRAQWDSTHLVWTPHRGRCHAFAFGTHFVGDRSSGTIFTYDLNTYQDTVPV
jgi:hypothetical protein